MNVARELLEIFRVFFGVGFLTFGGGITMLPILERELIKKRQWITGSQLVDWFSLSQCIPGAIAVNVSTFIGHHRRGKAGAVAAALGVVSPSILVITILAVFLSNFMEYEAVRKALRGINVAVAVLLCSAIWSYAKKTIVDLFTAAIAIAACIAMIVFNAPGALIVVSAAVLGLASLLFRRRS